MTHRHLALVEDAIKQREMAMPPDDRDGWQRGGQHSNTDDGRLLARIDERTLGIMRQIDEIAETANRMFEGQGKEIALLDGRITILERNWTRAVAYGGVAMGVVLLLAPILQSGVKVLLHLP